MDERHNVPSASAMYRISNCPASFRYGQQFPDLGSDDAATGDKIHKALERWGEHGATDGLDFDELKTAEACIDQRNEILDTWVGEDDYTAYVERRLGMTPVGKVVEMKGQPIKIMFSGKADFAAVSGKRGLVIDYKTLHGDHDHAEVNDQLRALAVLLFRAHNRDAVRVAIVQPAKGKPTVADYSKLTLWEAFDWLRASLDAAQTAELDDTKPGDWCKYCPARIDCKAFKRLILASIKQEALTLPADDETARKALFARACELSNEELAARYKTLKMIGWYVNAVEGVTRMRAEQDPDFAAKHYRIVEGRPKETISDVSKVWAALEKHGVTPDRFAAACKTTKKAVGALIKEATGEKGKPLDAMVRAAIDGATKLSAPAKKLVAVGEQIEEGDNENE